MSKQEAAMVGTDLILAHDGHVDDPAKVILGRVAARADQGVRLAARREAKELRHGRRRQAGRQSLSRELQGLVRREGASEGFDHSFMAEWRRGRGGLHVCRVNNLTNPLKSLPRAPRRPSQTRLNVTN